MPEVVIGFCCEGEMDAIVLQQILSRFLAPEDGSPTITPTFKPRVAHGPIIGSLRGAVSLLIDKPPPSQIIVFLTDTGTSPRMCREVQIEAERWCKQHGFNDYVIACASPEVEAWLLRDEDLIKRVFNLPGHQPIIRLREGPKATLKHLISTRKGDVTEIPRDIYQSIASGLDLSILAQRDRGFRHFQDEFNTVLRRILGQGMPWAAT